MARPAIHAATALPLLSSTEMRAADAATIGAGISALTLMERAGKAVSTILLKQFSKQLKAPVILCGPGNNGGDGLVIARLLKKNAKRPIVLIAASKKYSAEFLRQLESARQAKIKLCVFSNEEEALVELQGATPVSKDEAQALIGKASLLVDALLGSGQQGAPHGAIGTLVELSRQADATLVSVDVPTGVDADSGAVYEPHLSPQLTICIQALKRGLLQFPARKLFGEMRAGLHCADIGISLPTAPEFKLAEARNFARFPNREPDAHKFSVGTVLVIGGSKAYLGAPVLSAQAALRTGAGYVRLAMPERPLAGIYAEILLSTFEAPQFNGDHLASLLGLSAELAVIAVGPGLGRVSAQFFIDLLSGLKQRGKPCVLDADALNIVAAHPAAAREQLPNVCIMTPHPGEAARLLGISSAQVQSDRYTAARALHEKYGATIILKGAQSIVYGAGQAPTGLLFDVANPWLASAGSGDVLTGMVAALLAQGLAPFDAAALAVHLHTQAAQHAHQRHSGPIIASDIIEALAWAIGTNRKA